MYNCDNLCHKHNLHQLVELQFVSIYISNANNITSIALKITFSFKVTLVTQVVSCYRSASFHIYISISDFFKFHYHFIKYFSNLVQNFLKNHIIPVIIHQIIFCTSHDFSVDTLYKVLVQTVHSKSYALKSVLFQIFMDSMNNNLN